MTHLNCCLSCMKACFFARLLEYTLIILKVKSFPAPLSLKIVNLGLEVFPPKAVGFLGLMFCFGGGREPGPGLLCCSASQGYQGDGAAKRPAADVGDSGSCSAWLRTGLSPPTFEDIPSQLKRMGFSDRGGSILGQENVSPLPVCTWACTCPTPG